MGDGGGSSAHARGSRRDGRPGHVRWVLEDNPCARRFYEREGWALDVERKEDEYVGLRVAEERYRIAL